MFARALAPWIALVIASCGGSTGATTPTSSEPRATPSAREASPTDDTTQPATTPTPSGPPPTLALRGTPDRSGHVAITVENRGTELARVAPRIVVERADASGSFAAVEGIESLELRFDCEHEPPACVELAPGAALHAPPWLGVVGHAQCECEECGGVPSGTYRFVVRSCDGHRVEGDAFDLRGT